MPEFINGFNPETTSFCCCLIARFLLTLHFFCPVRQFAHAVHFYDHTWWHAYLLNLTIHKYQDEKPLEELYNVLCYTCKLHGFLPFCSCDTALVIVPVLEFKSACTLLIKYLYMWSNLTKQSFHMHPILWLWRTIIHCRSVLSVWNFNL